MKLGICVNLSREFLLTSREVLAIYNPLMSPHLQENYHYVSLSNIVVTSRR